MNAPAYQNGQMGRHADLTLDSAVWLDAISAASAAPSLHNSQPWRFVVRPEAVELHLDPQRLLGVADPDGREARVSCGAALLNLRIALRAAGIEPLVALLPQRAHPTLLAIVRVAGRRPPSPDETALHRAIPHRHSHRHPFHPAPVPQFVLRAMVYASGEEGGYLRLIVDPPTVSAVAALTRRAEHLQQNDPGYRAELAAWTFAKGPRSDGVPYAASGPRPEPGDLVTIRDFDPDGERPTRHFEADPLFGVMLSATDSPMDQLRSGQALERALLTATEHGIAASMSSAPIELPLARTALRQRLGTSMWPQLVLRFGTRQTAIASPRRPLEEIVELPDQAEHQEPVPPGTS